MSGTFPGYIGSRALTGNLSQTFQCVAAQTIPDATYTVLTCLNTPTVSQSSGGIVSITQNVDGSYNIPLAGYYACTLDSFLLSNADAKVVANTQFVYSLNSSGTNFYGGAQYFLTDYSSSATWTYTTVLYFSGPSKVYLIINQDSGVPVSVGFSMGVAPPSTLTIQRLDEYPL